LESLVEEDDFSESARLAERLANFKLLEQQCAVPVAWLNDRLSDAHYVINEIFSCTDPERHLQLESAMSKILADLYEFNRLNDCLDSEGLIGPNHRWKIPPSTHE
jgi:hypothetical protein